MQFHGGICFKVIALICTGVVGRDRSIQGLDRAAGRSVPSRALLGYMTPTPTSVDYE